MRQMFTWGTAVALVLVAGGAAQAQWGYRPNPYANNVYYYQMMQRQQQLYYLAAQQRAAAYYQQQRWNALPAPVKQQAAAQAVAQAQRQRMAALELQRQRALLARHAGPKRNILEGYFDALDKAGQLGPFAPVVAGPLALFAPLAVFAGIAQAFGG